MKTALNRINERIAELTKKANESLCNRNESTDPKEWNSYNVDFITEDAKLGAFMLCRTLIEKDNAREQWISVKDELPKYTESLKIWDDEKGCAVPYGKKCKAFVLAYNEEIGVFKAEYHNGRWSEISSISSRGSIIVTHWQELPNAPKP